jgi:hypothetical protein
MRVHASSYQVRGARARRTSCRHAVVYYARTNGSHALFITLLLGACILPAGESSRKWPLRTTTTVAMFGQRCKAYLTDLLKLYPHISLPSNSEIPSVPTNVTISLLPMTDRHSSHVYSPRSSTPHHLKPTTPLRPTIQPSNPQIPHPPSQFLFFLPSTSSPIPHPSATNPSAVNATLP